MSLKTNRIQLPPVATKCNSKKDLEKIHRCYSLIALMKLYSLRFCNEFLNSFLVLTSDNWQQKIKYFPITLFDVRRVPGRN